MNILIYLLVLSEPVIMFLRAGEVHGLLGRGMVPVLKGWMGFILRDDNKLWCCGLREEWKCRLDFRGGSQSRGCTNKRSRREK